MIKKIVNSLIKVINKLLEILHLPSIPKLSASGMIEEYWWVYVGEQGGRND